MERFFNTAGPIKPERHYNIPPKKRIDLPALLSLINEEKYFVLHAPRQTGKTSLLLSLTEYLNQKEDFTCLYVNIEAAQAARENINESIRTILFYIANAAQKYLGDEYLNDKWNRIFEDNGAFSALYKILYEFSRYCSKPVVLFLDEVDSLVGDTLIALLRQLRAGYTDRPESFPQSIVLCGVRDVRDYRIHSDKEKTVITGGCAFNIKAQSLRLGNFDFDEIKALYLQHTEATGQIFKDDVFPLVWELTEGQPWLVNALAFEACFTMKECRDRKQPVTVEHIKQAAENIIIRRETHLDQLTDKLKEERVRRVIEPILSGSLEAANIPEDDVDYAVDLGIVVKDKQIRIANRIYKEIIPRQLTYSTQLTIAQETQWYIDDDGRLNMPKLFTAFQDFFRRNFEHWEGGFQYAEAGPQLFLQAFLQRIVNGGGRVEREYGIGRKRTDLMVIWPYGEGRHKSVQEIVIECKIRYGTMENTIKKGLEQTRTYMDKCGTDEGYLLLFDRTPDLPWETKIFKKTRKLKGKKIIVFGM